MGNIYSLPPPSRTFKEDKPTLLVCWWCTSFAATIILFRVTGRYIRTEKLFKEDWLAFACLIPLLIRMAFVHVVLLYGTNNMETDGVPDDIIRQRIIGSRLVLGSRIFYAATLWMLKLTISEFFKRLTPIHLWKKSYEWTFQFIRWFLLASFIGVVISDITECRPPYKYWQVVPDPGPQCRQGYAQLITMGVFNVITDILLILFPIPIIILSQISFKRKFQLTCLFALSVIPIFTTCIRIPNIIDQQGAQNYRSLWASVEILAATGVANALVLGSFVRDRGVKKLKFKHGSTSDSIERSSRRETITQRHWGSEEDLVRDFGFALDPEIRGADEAPKPRKAPSASEGSQAVRMDPIWRFPNGDEESEESDMVKFMNESAHSPGDISFTNTPRKVSFFDVGGLLDGDGNTNNSRGRNTSFATADGASLHATMSQESQSPFSSRKGSKTLIQDLGGLQNPSSPPSSRAPRGFKQVAMELQSIPPNRDRERERDQERPPIVKQNSSLSFQDVGGLLNDTATHTGGEALK